MRAIVLLVAGAAGLALFTGAYTPPNSKQTLVIYPIKATFNPAKRQTVYETHWFLRSGVKVRKVTATWTLTLKLVDPAGAPDPGEQGSAAAVDLGCTNDSVGLPDHPYEPNDIFRESSFTWHHPDAVDSVPPGKYHCNHAEMGPHGHQGLIKVVVTDKRWTCSATYRGTNTSTALRVQDGTASQPVCKRLF